MTNAFETHQLDHLSASSCNLFAAQPALWVAQKLLKRNTPVGAAAHRGAAVEAGVAMGLLDPTLDIKLCAVEADRVFRMKTALSTDPRRHTQGAAVAGIVKTVLPELRAYGRDVVCQERIEWRHESLPIPFVGYVDFRWPYHQILIDLKTQLALTSKIEVSHARQVALYAGAYGDNIDARITYSTPKKCATYQLENVREHVQSLVRIGQTIERFLSVSDDPLTLASIIMPDVDSFYWSDRTARQNAFEIYGI